MLVYISVTRGQTRKMVFAKEHFISGVFFAAVILNLASGRLLLFKRFLSHLSSQLDTALKYFFVFLIFVVGLLRTVSGPVQVGEEWFKKKKKPSGSH